jgi:hypothetical protein
MFVPVLTRFYILLAAGIYPDVATLALPANNLLGAILLLKVFVELAVVELLLR